MKNKMLNLLYAGHYLKSFTYVKSKVLTTTLQGGTIMISFLRMKLKVTQQDLEPEGLV